MELFLDILLVISVLCLVVCVGILVWILGVEISKCFLNYEVNPATVTVVDKKHKAAYSTTMYTRVGKVSVPQIHHHPAQFNVYVEWKNEFYTINNRELFYAVSKGDEIDAWVHIGYNKLGVAKDTYITAGEFNEEDED